MSRQRLTLLGMLLAAAALAAGCGGGGGGSLTPTGGGGTSHGSATSLKVKLVIPKAAGSAAHRRPAYVSTSTQSAVVQIFNGESYVTAGSDYVNLSSSNCTTAAGVMTCSFSIGTTITASGSYQVIIATYDAPQTASCTPLATPACAGNILSISNVPQSITFGSSTALSVTLGGVPAYLQPLEFVSGQIGGGGNGNHNILTVYGPGAKTLEFEFLDADQNIIIGNGVPVVTATGGPQLTAAVTQPSGGGGVYTLTLTPATTTSAVGPVVEPTSVPLSVTGTVPNGQVSFTVTSLATVLVRHAAIYVAEYTSAGSGVLTVDAYIDGNTTPYSTGYNSGTGYLGLATDTSSNIWIADAFNNNLIGYTALDPSVSPSETYIVSGAALAFPNPGNITFDSNNDAFVAFCGVCFSDSPSYAFAAYMAPSPTSTPFFTAPFTFTAGNSPEVGALAVDDSFTPGPHIYAGVTTATGSNVSAFMNGSTSSTVVPFAIPTPAAALSMEPGGNLWVLAGGIATEINPSTGAVLHTISGLPVTTTGMSVDYSGNVYFAENAPTMGIVEYSPPSFATATTILGTAVWPVSVAAVPNALFALNNPPGMQTPLPSPFPLGTP